MSDKLNKILDRIYHDGMCYQNQGNLERAAEEIRDLFPRSWGRLEMTDEEYADFLKWWKTKWMSSPDRSSAEQYLVYLKEKKSKKGK